MMKRMKSVIKHTGFCNSRSCFQKGVSKFFSYKAGTIYMVY